MKSTLLAASSVTLLLTLCCVEFPVRGELGERDQRGPKMHPQGAVNRWAHRMGPDGRLPDNAFVAAKAQRDAMLAADAASPESVGSGLRNWQWRGPGNVGGRVRGIAIHPTQTATMWIGTAGSGVWKTTDGGSNWFPLDDFLPVLAVGSIALDRADPNRLYVGTGEGGFFDQIPGQTTLAVPNGAGIFTTADGGTTWTQLPSTASWGAVSRIAIDPNNSSVLLAATNDGIQRSTDGGATWSLRTNKLTLDVEFHPTNSNLAIAGTGTNPGSVAQYSTDGGVTWQNATGTPASVRVEVAYAPNNPTTVYAAVSDGNGITLYRSTNGGQSYAQRSAAGVESTYSRYNVALWVSPTDENLVLVGGVNVQRSLNAGQNFSQITGTIHLDIHEFVAHPNYDGTNNRTVFGATDGGPFRNDSIASSSFWTPLNNGLGITQFYGASINPTSGVIVAGAQDNGTSRWAPGTGTNAWSNVFGGDGGHVEADRTDPNVFYGSYQWMNIFRSTNGGQSPSAFVANGLGEPTPNFITPFELDPNAPTRMYTGGLFLWRSHNVKTGFPTWSQIKPSIVGAICTSTAEAGVPGAHFALDPPCNISAIDIAVGDSNVVWVGHNSGQVFMTTDALADTAPTWTQVDVGWPLPRRQVSDISIDPNDHDRVLVAFQGYATDGLWLTEDAGASWALVTGGGASGLPAAPVTTVLFHPIVRKCIYVGTDIGMFWSGDDGQTWATDGAGPGNVPIDEIEWRDNRTLLVVTHGRGCYEADSFDVASIATVGAGCGLGGGSPSLTATPPVVGVSQSYAISGAAPNAPVILMLGDGGPVSMPLGGCVFEVGQPFAFPVGNTDGAGAFQLAVFIPAQKEFLDAEVTGQALVVVMGGPLFGIGELTNGIHMFTGL